MSSKKRALAVSMSPMYLSMALMIGNSYIHIQKSNILTSYSAESRQLYEEESAIYDTQADDSVKYKQLVVVARKERDAARHRNDEVQEMFYWQSMLFVASNGALFFVGMTLAFLSGRITPDSTTQPKDSTENSIRSD